MTENGTPRPGILRNRNYVVLLSGQLVSQVGNSFYPLAIYWFTFSLTRSQLDLGYLSAVISVTGLAGILTGVLVDRWDRRRTMIWSDIIRTALAGALALLALTGRLGLAAIFTFGALLGLVANLFSPAEAALLPNVVGMDELGAASGLNQGASAGASLVGTSFGGFLLGIFSPTVLLVLDALSFVVSFVSVGALRLPREATMPRGTSPAETLTASKGFLAELTEGIRFVFGQPFFRRLALIGMALNFAFMPLNVMDVVWVRQVLHLGAFAYGLFGAAITLGVIAGSVATGPLMQRFKGENLIVFSMALIAATYTAFSRLPYFVPDLAILFAFGIGIGIVNPVAQTLFQRAVPQHLMGRAVGALVSVNQGAMPLGALLAGFAASAMPLSTVFLLGGILMLLTLLLAVRLPKAPTLVEAQAAEGSA